MIYFHGFWMDIKVHRLSVSSLQEEKRFTESSKQDFKMKVCQLALLLALMGSISLCLSISRASSCRNNGTLKLLMKQLLPLARGLGRHAVKAKNMISNRWLTTQDKYAQADIQLPMISRPTNRNETKPLSVLKNNRQVLEAFLPYIEDVKKEFQVFSSAKELESELKEVIWNSRVLVFVLDGMQAALRGHSLTNVDGLKPSESALNMTTSSINQSNYQATGTRLAFPGSGLCLNASAILDELYGDVLQMQVEFNKIAKQICS